MRNASLHASMPSGATADSSARGASEKAFGCRDDSGIGLLKGVDSDELGLPAPVREPAMSYMSLTPAVSPVSGPVPLPVTGAARLWGTKNAPFAASAGFASGLLSCASAEVPMRPSAPAAESNSRRSHPTPGGGKESVFSKNRESFRVKQGGDRA